MIIPDPKAYPGEVVCLKTQKSSLVGTVDSLAYGNSFGQWAWIYRVKFRSAQRKMNYWRSATDQEIEVEPIRPA